MIEPKRFGRVAPARLLRNREIPKARETLVEGLASATALQTTLPVMALNWLKKKTGR